MWSRVSSKFALKHGNSVEKYTKKSTIVCIDGCGVSQHQTHCVIAVAPACLTNSQKTLHFIKFLFYQLNAIPTTTMMRNNSTQISIIIQIAVLAVARTMEIKA